MTTEPLQATPYTTTDPESQGFFTTRRNYPSAPTLSISQSKRLSPPSSRPASHSWRSLGTRIWPSQGLLRALPAPRGVLFPVGLIPRAVRRWLRSSPRTLWWVASRWRSRGWQVLSRRRSGRALETAQDIEGPGTRQHDGPDRHSPRTARTGKGVHAEDPRQQVSPVEPMGSS